MSDHDFLTHEFIRLIKLFEDYIEEYEPQNSDEARKYLKMAQIIVHNFANQEQL